LKSARRVVALSICVQSRGTTITEGEAVFRSGCRRFGAQYPRGPPEPLPGSRTL